MPRHKKNVEEQLLHSAKTEFLANGYEKASIRRITESAGISTSAVYVRYADKRGLYMALVESPASGLKQLLRACLETVCKSTAGHPENFYELHYQQDVPLMVDYIYEHYDAFRLLASCGEKDTLRGFSRDLASIELEYAKRTITELLGKESPSDEILLLFHQSFYMGLFEIVIHNMPADRIDALVGPLSQYYALCWSVGTKGGDRHG